MPKEERLKMTINGSPVAEIDISGSYLTMLHGLQGAPFNPTQDPYAVEGIERRIVKAWTTATLGYDRHLKKWPPKTVEDFKEKTGQHLPSVVKVKDVRKAMEKRHPVLESWDDCPINWAVLMYNESKAVIATMLELMGRGIPSLAVHDSLIVRAEDQETAHRVLVARYGEVAGITPEVKVTRLDQDQPEADLAVP